MIYSQLSLDSWLYLKYLRAGFYGREPSNSLRSISG